jgi:hypothetical protein
MMLQQPWVLTVFLDNRPDDKPQQSLATCDMAKLVAVMEEDVKISRYRYKILAARILCEFLPEFGFLKELIPAHYIHKK